MLQLVFVASNDLVWHQRAIITMMKDLPPGCGLSFILGQNWLQEHSAAVDYGKKQNVRFLKGGKVHKLVCEDSCLDADDVPVYPADVFIIIVIAR